MKIQCNKCREITPSILRKIIGMRGKGYLIKTIAERLNLSTSLVKHALKVIKQTGLKI